MKTQGTLIVPALALASSIIISNAAPADQNWGQWRGPQANGVAPNADPPTEWSETKNVKWKYKIPGLGASTPIVWDNLVFIQTAVPNPAKPAARIDFAPQFAGLPQQQQPPANAGQQPPPGGGRRRGPGGGGGRGEAPKDPHQFMLIAVDRATGKPAWQKMLREEIPHEPYRVGDGSFASASPITDGQSVFAYFGSRGLYSLDLKGDVRWQKDLGKARIKNTFGEGSSPALHGNTLVVNWDHEGEDFIAAFEKNTGKELWKQPRDEDTTWGTPLIVQHGGQAQVIINATKMVRSYDLTTGKELWSVGPLTANSIPTAVTGHGMVYSTSGFRGAALFAVKLGKTGDLTGTDGIAWSHNQNTPYVPSPMLYDDRLYFFKGNEATLSILDAKNGKPFVDAKRMEGIRGVYASPVGAAGRVYLVGRDGGTLVLKKSDEAEVLATNKLEDRFDASPAIAGKELFLRGENLYCIARTDGARADAK